MLQLSLFWGSLSLVVALRLLSMWAFDPKALARLPWLRYFRPNDWLVFRLLSFPSALLLSVFGFASASFGHGVGSAFYALVALAPGLFEQQRLQRLLQRTNQNLWMLSLFGAPALVAFGVAFCFMEVNPMQRLGYALQAAGNALMCLGFVGMMSKAWGAESAATWRYLILATLWDVILLVGVSLLYASGQPVGGFVVLEVCIIFTELLRWGAKLREG